MSSYHTSPNQNWQQPAFSTAIETQQHTQNLVPEEEDQQGFTFNSPLATQQHPAQSQGQIHNSRPGGFYHAQTYPIVYPQQQQTQIHHQQQPHETLQAAFVSGHVNPSSAAMGGSSGAGQHRSLSFGSAPGNSRSIDPLFPATNHNFDPSRSSYSSSDYNPYENNPNTTSFGIGQPGAEETNLEAMYSMSPESITGYTSPIRAPAQLQSQSWETLQQHSAGQSASKRMRPDKDTSDRAEKADGKAEGANGKPVACQRCKGLKVKCESSSEEGICKKCLNGGHECLLPGKKPRRKPPKREHLLGQIRDQASVIQNLMTELEEVNRTFRGGKSTASDSGQHRQRESSPNGSHSTGYAPSNYEPHSYFSDYHSNSGVGESPNKAVLDWMDKARESLAAFGGYIGIGGAGMAKKLLMQEDPEDSNDSEDEDGPYITPRESDGEIDIAFEDPEGRAERQYREGSRPLRRRVSDSSVGTAGMHGLAIHPKRDQGKMAIIPNETAPFGLMAELALKKAKRESSAERSDKAPEEEMAEEETGIANVDFFKPAPGPDPLGDNHGVMSAQQKAPHILTRNVLTPAEAEKLFSIYFDYMNLSVSLLDPVLYTAQKTCWRSPFLFTVICAIASRHYTERPDLHTQVMHYAQLAAGSELISGHKSVETVSAYILLALYPVPALRWEEDRSWVYLGLAIRIATDLNLHHPNTAKPINEQHAREMLNRTRIWLNCFNLDRSMSSQYGKSPIIRNTDYVAMHSEEWYESSEYNMKNFDIHLATYNAELRLVFDFVGKIYSDPNHPTGLNKEVDFERLATEADDALVRLSEKWFAKIDQTDLSNPQNCFRTGLLKLAFSYSRLISLSYGFQHSFGKSDTDENPFLLRCLRAATDVVNYVVDDIGRPPQRIYLRHGPEAQSVFVTFACAFLVKLLQPKFISYLSQAQRVEIRRQVQRVIDLLGSPEVAIDKHHGPKLYSRFLKGLLATPMAKVESSSEGGSQPRRTRRSPEIDRPYETNASGSNHPSPATSHSLSPPPESTLAIPFDQFAPVSGGIDPLLPLSDITRAFIAPMDVTQDMHGSNMLTSDFFRPPLPFDDDILQSMQALSADPMWGDMSLPGFGWMHQYQPNNDDGYMKANETMNFEQQFGSGGYAQM